MNVLEFAGYHAAISFDSDIDMLMGKVINAQDVITFYGSSISQLKDEFKKSITEYLAFCKKKGVKPHKPYSGKFNVRLDPNLHAQLSIAAAKRGMSLNSFVETTLAKETEETLCA